MCVRQPFNTLKRLNLNREPRTQRSQESAGNTSKVIEKGSKIPLTTEDMQALFAQDRPWPASPEGKPGQL